MKKLNKTDVWGVVLSAGVGVITALIYFTGKFGGKAEAYGECSDQLMELVKLCEEVDAKE